MMLSDLKKTFYLGFKNLFKHPLRSILTMLGIVCGVASVIAMLAVGEGASFESQERIKNLGSKNIILRSIKPLGKEKASNSDRNFSAAVYGLTQSDYRRIKATIPDMEEAVPVWEAPQTVANGPYRIEGLVRGTTPSYPQIAEQKLFEGRYIHEPDMQSMDSVCVISDSARRKLFPFENPVDKFLKIGGSYYRVIGLIGDAGAGREELGLDPENKPLIFIPLTNAYVRFGKTVFKRKMGSVSADTVELHYIIIKMRDVSRVIAVSTIVETLLQKFHQKIDYEIVVPIQLLEELKRNARMFRWVLGMIAAISLIIGGIGIMNIMLANIAERTREIGIRRAVGASQRAILKQFLSETIVLSFAGGFFGLGLGVVIPLLIALFTGMKVIFTAWSFIFAFGISILTGIVFGFYPAYRAAKMDPIEALRSV